MHHHSPYMHHYSPQIYAHASSQSIHASLQSTDIRTCIITVHTCITTVHRYTYMQHTVHTCTYTVTHAHIQSQEVNIINHIYHTDMPSDKRPKLTHDSYKAGPNSNHASPNQSPNQSPSKRRPAYHTVSKLLAKSPKHCPTLYDYITYYKKPKPWSSCPSHMQPLPTEASLKRSGPRAQLSLCPEPIQSLCSDPN